MCHITDHRRRVLQMSHNSKSATVAPFKTVAPFPKCK